MRPIILAALLAAPLAAQAQQEPLFTGSAPPSAIVDWENTAALPACKTGWHLTGSSVETDYTPFLATAQIYRNEPPHSMRVDLGGGVITLTNGQSLKLSCFDDGDVP